MMMMRSLAVASAASIAAFLELQSSTMESLLATPDEYCHCACYVCYSLTRGTSIRGKRTHNGHRNFLALMIGAPGSMITSNAPRLARRHRIQCGMLKSSRRLQATSAVIVLPAAAAQTT